VGSRKETRVKRKVHIYCIEIYVMIRTVKRLLSKIFIHQLKHNWIVLKRNFKIYIEKAPTCFDVKNTILREHTI
jgi:hypothetical protein